MKRLPERYCVGRFDLLTHRKSVCPLVGGCSIGERRHVPLARRQTGFNPSFYYAEAVSPQQRVYNETPHYVYLAYFSKQHIKAGISSETRGTERLLEQGARAACVVGRFSNAYEARNLEAALCAQPQILETMRASVKARLLAEEPYSPVEACEVLENKLSSLAQIDEAIQAGFSPEKPRRIFRVIISAVLRLMSVNLRLPGMGTKRMRG